MIIMMVIVIIIIMTMVIIIVYVIICLFTGTAPVNDFYNTGVKMVVYGCTIRGKLVPAGMDYLEQLLHWPVKYQKATEKINLE